MGTTETSSLSHFTMSFDGALLQRGFWVYVWRITHGAGLHLYVGRTGDSSSPHAGSPFTRIGQHLDVRSSAKGNALGKRLNAAGVTATDCKFAMIAIGPLFPEADSMELHCPLRDQVGAVEKALAELLRLRGYSVLGVHHSGVAPDRETMNAVAVIIDEHFPAL